ncbi:hypothetical protein DEI86_06455 [Curtobacterium sp. MCBD17_028]|nr:hypothetical protein DEI86_06455 [Curtobacterium sp. MCBD17_028]
MKAGRLTQWDRKLLKPFTDWVTADRSQSGEAHTLSGKPEKEDVFLMAHVVGAVIVRLSTGRLGDGQQE